MRLRVVPENWIERLAVWWGLAPTPMVETLQAVIMARAIMAACKLGIFESLASGPATAQQLANRLKLDRFGTEKLLGALAASRYVRSRRGQYQLTRIARKWLVPASPYSLHHNMLLRYLEWQALDHLEHFVSTGQPVDAHDVMPEDAWPTYQRGLSALARLSAREIASRVRLPEAASSMLDVGGAHGRYAAALCERYRRLQATILELPEAVDSARRVFLENFPQATGVATRIAYRGGDALSDPWWEQEWDLVFVSQLVHHFSAEQNQLFVRRAAGALRPGGLLCIVDAVKPAARDGSSQTVQLLDLFFATTSRSGTWSIDEVRTWQSSAGLTCLPVAPLRTLPGVVMLLASKPTGT